MDEVGCVDITHTAATILCNIYTCVTKISGNSKILLNMVDFY